MRPSCRSSDELLEDLLHQRIEPGGGLVEHEQLDVGGERGDERDLLPVSSVGAAAPGRVELEPLQELVAPRRIEAAAQAREQVDRLASGEVRPRFTSPGT